MEDAAAAAAAWQQAEATRSAVRLPTQAPRQPGCATRGHETDAPGQQAGGAVPAAVPGEALRAHCALKPAGRHKRKPGRPALHQGCQVCGIPLASMRSFHQKYHICEAHAAADSVQWKGEPQRFCQQCGRFHPLDAFAPGMRSCRNQLAKHAKRRSHGRELAAQAPAAADAPGSSKPAASSAAPVSKRPRPVTLSVPEPPTARATRLLRQPSTWRLTDSTSSGGSSGLHQSAHVNGMDALLAAAEEDALAEADGMEETKRKLKREPHPDAPPQHLEPDLSWFAGAATAPLLPPPLPAAAATMSGLGTAHPIAGPGDSALATLAALGSGPAALAAAAAEQQAQQAQQAQLLTLLLAQQQLQQQSALAALLSTAPAVQPSNSDLLLALMQQAAFGQPATPRLQAPLLQQLLGSNTGGGAPALLQQAAVQQPFSQAVLGERQAGRELHGAMLYQAAVEGLLQTVLQVSPQGLTLPDALMRQMHPAQRPLQQPAEPAPWQQPTAQQRQQAAQPSTQQRLPEEPKQRTAAAAAASCLTGAMPAPAQPLLPPAQRSQPAWMPFLLAQRLR